jgi:hypothetical protein
MLLATSYHFSHPSQDSQRIRANVEKSSTKIEWGIPAKTAAAVVQSFTHAKPQAGNPQSRSVKWAAAACRECLRCETRKRKMHYKSSDEHL